MDLICGIFQEAGAIGATLEALIAAFCYLAKSLSYSTGKRLVGRGGGDRIYQGAESKGTLRTVL
jgi:hypothetical protein